MTRKILKIAMLSANYVFCTYCVGAGTSASEALLREDLHENNMFTGRNHAYTKGQCVQTQSPSPPQTISNNTISRVIPRNQECIPDNTYSSYRSTFPFLQTLAFESNSRVESIGERAFDSCSKLSQVYIPESVRVIKPCAFAGCDKLSSVVFEAGSKLQTIGRGAFYRCKSLAFIEIPASVETIGARAFGWCPHLQNIEFEQGSQLTTIDEETFADCHSLASIIIPSTVTTIGPEAFHNCSSLTYVGISKNGRLREIGAGAFAGCKNLVGIEIPSSVQKIGNGAFYDTNIEIHMSAESIPIPEGSQERKEATRAFLSNILTYPKEAHIAGYDRIVLPEIPSYSNGSVVWVGNDKWQLIDAAKEKWRYTTAEQPPEEVSLKINTPNGGIVEADPENRQILDGSASFTVSLSGLDTIPSLVLWRSFGFSANKVQTVIVPTGVTAIGTHAFMNCKALSDITLPKSVRTIGEVAFKDCTALQSITIPQKVENMGAMVFYNCTALETVTFEAGSELNEIADSAFEGCTALRSITIPSEVVNIGSTAFSSCTALQSITIPSKIENIEYSAFSDCTTLETVTFEAESELQGIAHLAFRGCTALRSITIPSKVKDIGLGVFEGCTKLETVTFEAGCSLEQIQGQTFQNCSSLKNIQIPEGVERIEREAFDGCTSLANVTLPASLNKAENIFSNCPNLTEVTWNITRPTDNETFCTSLKSMLGVRTNCTVKLKDGTEFLCSATAGWYHNS